MIGMKVVTLRDIPLVKKGDDIGEVIVKAIKAQKISIRDDDIILISQSIISKSEGNVINLNKIKPSERSIEISEKIDKDPRAVEVILRHSERILKLEKVLISETKHGFVCANAGVDSSNSGSDRLTLLPENPDESAVKIRNRIYKLLQIKPSIIITDTQGRAFRKGALGVAIGIAGLIPVSNLHGRKDLYGEELKNTEIATADALAAVGSLTMGEANEGTPIVIIKKAIFESGEGTFKDLLRSREEDLFR